jgi:nucleoid-associated protein YgaU
MNKESPYRHQAEQNRRRVVRKNTVKETGKLPSRNKVHGKKRQIKQWKVKYPLIRLLVLFFIFLPITIYSAYQYFYPEVGNGKVVHSSGGYRISVEANHKQKILYHKVEQGDTLPKLSLKYYHSEDGVETIRKANNLQGYEVEIGQVLKVPITE